MDTTKKKAIIYSVIFVCVIGLIVGLVNLIIYLTKPNNHNETRFGVYKIRMVGWEGTQGRMFTQWAQETLPQLNRLGPTFQLVESDENISVLKINIVDRNDQCANIAAIAYQRNTLTGVHRIIIDPICTQGELQFKAAFMHEIGHSLGMSHICTTSDRRNDCSPVGRGPAVMNPHLLNETRNENSLHTINVGVLPTWEIQDLDIREFCRIRNCGKH